MKVDGGAIDTLEVDSGRDSNELGKKCHIIFLLD